MAFDTAETLLADAPLEGELVAALALDPATVELVRDELSPEAFTVADLRAAYAAALAGTPFVTPATAPAPDPATAARRLAELHGGRQLAPALPLLARKLTALSAGKVSLAETLASFSAAANAGVEAA